MVVEVGQNDGELVPLHPRHRVRFPDRLQKTLGAFLENQIGGGLTSGFNDCRKTIHIEEQQGHGPAGASGQGQAVTQAVLEEIAVGQVGQGIVIGQVFLVFQVFL